MIERHLIRAELKLIKWFSIGFLLSAVLAIALLVQDYFLNSWAGNSPLNSIYLIPLFYLFHLFLLALFLWSFRKGEKQSSFIFMAGVVSGGTLVLLPRQTAALISGSEIPTLLIVEACMSLTLWISTRTRP